MVKCKIILILFLVLRSINCLSQDHIPSDDTLQRLFNGDFPKDEENEEHFLKIKNDAAWLLGKETYILQNIEQAIKDNNINHNQFAGIEMLVESKMELPKDKVQNILSIKQAINKNFGTNKEIYNYLMFFDIIIAKTYFEPDQIDSLTKAFTYTVNSGLLDLEDDLVRNLFDLNILNFELKKDSIAADSFVAAYYKKYPKILANNYLHYHFNKGNYKTITKHVSTSEPNPFLAIEAGISHFKLNQKDSAMLFFDIIITLYNKADNYDKEIGSLPCLFEDDLVMSCTLFGDNVLQMLEFYGNNSQKEKACTTLQLLKAIANQESTLSKFKNQNNNHLKGPKRMALEDQAIQKLIIEDQIITAAIKKWSEYCSL